MHGSRRGGWNPQWKRTRTPCLDRRKGRDSTSKPPIGGKERTCTCGGHLTQLASTSTRVGWTSRSDLRSKLSCRGLLAAGTPLQETRRGAAAGRLAFTELASTAGALAVKPVHQRIERGRLRQRQDRLKRQWIAVRIMAIRDAANRVPQDFD